MIGAFWSFSLGEAMQQIKLDRERIRDTEEIQLLDNPTYEQAKYLFDTYSLIDKILHEARNIEVGGHSFIDEVSVYGKHLYVRIRWADGDSDTLTFPADILDSDDPVKAAKVDTLKEKIVLCHRNIKSAEHIISSGLAKIVEYQQELVKLTGNSKGE